MYLHLFAELKRRRVFRALLGYGIAAFAVLQIVEPVMHGLRWPELARAIVQALKPRLVPAVALVQQTTSSTEAHDLYLKGRYFWNQRSDEGFAKARALFE